MKQYEIYIDTLFWLNFGMNLYLLELTNHLLHHTAVQRRILIGAIAGGIVSVVPFWILKNVAAAGSAGFVLSVLCMGAVTFKVTDMKAYGKVLETLTLMTIVLGAMLLYMLNILSEKWKTSLPVVLVAGGLCFLVLSRFIIYRNRKQSECTVILCAEKTRIKIKALVDTGNSLIEPISGEPVAVLDKDVFDKLFFEERPGGFRVIPYRTIDRRAGILQGYLIKEIHIEWDGLRRVFRNVYVGVRPMKEEEKGTYKMILNPKMLKGRK